uniref:Uncharacterized protein n=1 Tax=Panagrolaimus sp. JU765 TaxID=591449 RepID=A0AC34R323_9BILA
MTENRRNQESLQPLSISSDDEPSVKNFKIDTAVLLKEPLDGAELIFEDDTSQITKDVDKTVAEEPMEEDMTFLTDGELDNFIPETFMERSKKQEYAVSLSRELTTEDRAYIQVALRTILNDGEGNYKDEIDEEQKKNKVEQIQKIKQIAKIYDSIEIDTSLDIPGLDNNTKNMDMKTFASYSVRQSATSIPKINQYRKPKVTERGKKIYFDDPEIEDVVPNSSGCARFEAFKKKDVFKSIKGGNISGRQFTVITEEVCQFFEVTFVKLCKFLG